MKLPRYACAAAFLLFLADSASSMSQTIKRWDFALPHGSLRIGVEATPDGSISLSMGPSGSVKEAPVAEQVEPLKQVLAELPNLGLDPRKLAYLGTRIFDEDVLKKLAYACADSQAWKSSMRAGGTNKNRIVVELLNQSGAYEPLNAAFRPYDLQVRVTEAEKVGLMRFSKVPPRNTDDKSRATLLVPADAMLGMRFSQVQHK